MNVPTLRFKEFTDSYKKMKYKDVLKIKSGKDQKQIECKNGKYPILGTSGKIGTTNMFLYNKPSVLIGRKGTINKPQYMETPFWTVDTLFYSQIYKPNIPKYLFYSFQNVNWQKYDESTGVPSLSSSTIESVECFMPSMKEQIKVSNFLSLLDKKMELQTKKIEALKLFKLSIKNKLFKTNNNYEIRINQLVKCESSNLTLSDIQDSDGAFPIYGAEGFIKNINFYNHNHEYIGIVKDGAGVGRVMVCPSKSSTISTMNALVPILEYKASYILELLNSINFKKYIIGSGIPHIYFKDYGKEKIKIHNIDESNKITKLFDLINKKIDCSQYQIGELKKLKKWLLQNMFI